MAREVIRKLEESVNPDLKIKDPRKFELGKKPRHYKKPLKKDSPGWTHSTHTGIALSMKEEMFINEYINNGGDKYKAYDVCGGVAKDKNKAIARMMKPYIQEEISYRMGLVASKGVADANEIMQYFTQVMRGEVNDQFGLDAPLSERTAAARELAKRQIDALEKAQASKKNIDMTIVLDWERPDRSNIEQAEQNLEEEKAELQAKIEAEEEMKQKV